MSDLRRRLTRLENATASGKCPGCADLTCPVRFLRTDGTAYPGSAPDVCPRCGRRIQNIKTIVGVDPQEF